MIPLGGVDVKIESCDQVAAAIDESNTPSVSFLALWFLFSILPRSIRLFYGKNGTEPKGTQPTMPEKSRDRSAAAPDCYL